MSWRITGQILDPATGETVNGVITALLDRTPARTSTGGVVDRPATPIPVVEGDIIDTPLNSVPGAVWTFVMPLGQRSVRMVDPGDGASIDLGGDLPVGTPVPESEAVLLRREWGALREQTIDAVDTITSSVDAATQAADTIADVVELKPKINQSITDAAAAKQTAQAATQAAADAASRIDKAVASQDSATAQNVLSGAQTQQAIGAITPTTTAQAYKLAGDGVTDDAAKLAAAPAGAAVYLPTGSYRMGSSATISANIVPAKGASIVVPTGVTVKVTGAISADARDVFIDEGGKVDLTASPSQYNLAWFRSGNGYINERWDFARRSMATFVGKQVIIPRPYAGQAGVVLSGTRPFWGFNGPLTFADVNNTLGIYILGEFKAVANCSSFLGFTDAAKPEDVYFYGDLRVLVPPDITVDVGIDMQACARVTFWGNVVINGAKTSVRMGSPNQVAPVGSLRFFQLQASFFSKAAVSIYGKAPYSAQDIQIDRLSCTAAQVAGLNVVEIRGLVRNVNIPVVIYSTDTAKNGYQAFDAANVVLIESNAEGAIFYVNIGQIYQANAVQGFTIQTDSSAPQAADKIQGVTIERIHSKYQGIAGTVAACTTTQIRDIFNSGDLTIASSAIGTRVTSGGALRNITNNGQYTTINGLGSQSRGAGVAPAAAGPWPVGGLVRETADNKIYLRVANTGAASDFVVLN